MYKGRYFNRSSVIVCGDYMDGDIYPVYQPAGRRRSRCRPTSKIQEKLNQRNAKKKLIRIIHNNFGENDIALHLTFRPDRNPATLKEARRELRNFLGRLRRFYRKKGIVLKYIVVVEYGKRGGRVHFHLILTGGVDRDELEKLWGNGYANSKRLQFDADGLTALANYITKDRVTYKRWSGSRNLIQPVPQVKDGAVTMGDMEEMRDAIDSRNAHAYFERQYPGFELTKAVCTQNGVNRGWYIHFEMRRKPGRPRGAKALKAPRAALHKRRGNGGK